MKEPAPADLIAWMESNSRKLTLLEDERDSLRMENEALRKRNKQLELAAEPAGARILKLARENDALRKRNEKLESVIAVINRALDANNMGPQKQLQAIEWVVSDLDKEDA